MSKTATKTRKENPTTTKARVAKAKADKKAMVYPASPLMQKVVSASKAVEYAAKEKKAGKQKSGGKLSCLDAATKVLGESKAPMTTKEMIEAMAAKGLWSSPNGQTPAATLYSAILREISTKGKEARFKKTDRGQFVIRG